MASQAVRARSIIRRDRPAPVLAMPPWLASRHADRAAVKAGSSTGGKPALRWRAAKAAAGASCISPATRRAGRPARSASAVSAKAIWPDRMARRSRPAFSWPQAFRWATRRARSTGCASALKARVARSCASRLARSLRAGVSQPEDTAKAESDSASRVVTLWRTSRGRSGRARTASRRRAASPWRSTMRIRLPVVIWAPRLRASATRASASPISARAPATAGDRFGRRAMARRTVRQPMATPSTRSASPRTGERARTMAAISAWSPASPTISVRGAVAQPAQASARARRTRLEGSSRSARRVASASQAMSSERPS